MALLVHMCALIVWAGYLEARVNMLEAKTQHIPAISETLARMDERIGAIRDDITHVRRQVEKLGDVPQRR